MSRIIKIITIASLLVLGVLCGVVAGVFIALTRDLPQIQSLENFKPSAVTRIYSSDKVLLSELYAEKRHPVPIQSMPPHLKAALVATEDRNFYRHSGVDLRGILRALVKDLSTGQFAEGASTITQQLAKTLFLTSQKTIVRKIKEAFLAFQLERRYTKDEILELYMNQVYFGSGAYGVESAARLFFGKSVNDLTLSESALIAGMPQAPSRYSPLVNKNRAAKRRNLVLKQMEKTGIITTEDYERAVKEPIDVAGSKRRVKAPYFVEYVKRFLESTIGETRLYREGLNVYTTLSEKLQIVAERSIHDGLTALEKRMNQRGMKNTKAQGALIAMDIETGGILAMVGGKDFYDSPFNRSTQALRQPGSAFKPILYAYAIEQGFPQNHLILDAPIVFRGANAGEDWRPENFSKTYKGEITFRRALATSENIPAVRLIEKLGPSSVAQFAHKLGITARLEPNLTLALGSSGVRLMELTACYAVFANQGNYNEPFGVLEVSDRAGRMIWRRKPKKKAVMSRAGAAIMTNMLEGVVREGTGRKARSLIRPVAGKTGTTNDFRDALFIGFSPSIAAGVWVGQDSYVALGNGEEGARAALPAWIQFMREALKETPLEYFDIPDDVVQVRINPTSGLPSGDGDPDGVFALFKKGTEPAHY